MAKEVTNQSGLAYNALTCGSQIMGNIVSEKDFRIDGEVVGDLNCKGKVIIGPTGVLRGNIQCENAEIIGRVKGNLQVNDTITLRASANIVGDISTKVMVVEPSAVFNGSCSMKEIKSDSSAKTE